MTRTLREWLTQLEADDELKRISAKVSLDEEMAAITYVAHKERGAPALLFENIRDVPTGFRVLFNMFSASPRRYAMALDLDPQLSETDLIEETRSRLATCIDPRYVDSDSTPLFENTDLGNEIDLTKFPVPRMWPADGGRYIGTADLTITRNPDTGVVNVGTYRQMVHNATEVGLHTSPGKDLRLHQQRRWERDEPLDVVAVYGSQPELYLASQLSFGEDTSEIEHAGGLRGAPVELVNGQVTDLPIPAGAEIAVEGRLYPRDTRDEGPFGEFTGYYGRSKREAPVLSIDAVHYRDDPILTSALMADYPGCDINLTYSVGRSAKIWNDLDRLGITGIEGVYAHPAAASGQGMTIVSIDQQYAGHVSQVLSLASQCPGGAFFSKVIVGVDDDVDPTNIDQVLWAIATRYDAASDTDFLTDTWSTYLDPSRNPEEERPYGSKILIDATKDHRFYESFPARAAIREEVYEQVVERWNEYGFDGTPAEVPLFHEESGA